ncbi:MAG: ABC transporter ATP-binding protein [Myxococcota bacterium]
MSSNSILKVNIEYLKTLDGYHILRDISFGVYKNETLCIIGESGSGKSMTGYSIMGLLPQNLLFRGDIEYSDDNVTIKDPSLMRGKKITMIFQEPMTALNPLFSIGNQLSEVLPDIDKAEQKKRILTSLKDVGIRDAERVYNSYPHQLSGGMRQRALIAMAFLPQPSVVIADEPTTALDVTIASGILSLIKHMKQRKGISLIFISHDMNIVEKIADRIIVMYGGTIMEAGSASEILNNPMHPYTLALKRLFEERRKGHQRRLMEIKGFVPSIRDMPAGCPFNPRCNRATDICRERFPELLTEGESHQIRCLNYKDASF